jgi:hypothetical protein
MKGHGSMGLDYSFLLYFPKHRLWDVLEGVVAIASPNLGTTRIQFPGEDRQIPLPTFSYKKENYTHTDPRFSFATSLGFPEDEVILDYVRDLEDEEDWRAPPDPDGRRTYYIGFIYLTVYADLRAFSRNFTQQDLVAMNFVSAGTTMSLVFSESPAMRKTFIKLLEDYEGVIGVLNRELEAELFWWRGEELEVSIGSAYTPPDEIDAMVKRFKAGKIP